MIVIGAGKQAIHTSYLKYSVIILLFIFFSLASVSSVSAQSPSIKDLLLSWLTSIQDRNGDSKVNSLDFASLLSLSPTPTPSGPTSTPIPISGNSRGYVTTPGELLYVKQKAASGVEPYKSAKDTVISYANNSLRTFNAPDAQCSRQNDYWYNSYTIEAKAIAYWLTGDTNYATQVVAGLRDATAHPASRLPSGNGDQCNLNAAWYPPGVVIAADLMEGYSGWSASDKQAFQNYLANSVYPFAAASGRNSNNWGTGGDMSSAYIADYLWNRSDLRLTTLDNTPRSPAQAYEFHAQRQIGRINGTYIYNSACPLDPGIRADGGLSEELERGSTGCYGTTLLACDASWTYSITSLESVIMHAELLWRRGSGDRRIYDNVGPNGKGQLKKAILFVVNSSCDWKDSHKHSLELTFRYYRDTDTACSLGVTSGSGCRSGRYIGDHCGSMMHYGTISHGFAVGENPGPPPRVPAP